MRSKGAAGYSAPQAECPQIRFERHRRFFMLSILGLVIGGLFVVGFYGYVFAHLYGEYARHRVSRRDLEAHVTAIKADEPKKIAPANASASTQRRNGLHDENLLNLAIAAVGLLGLFGELFVLNGLLAATH
jgi:hypothetical protein